MTISAIEPGHVLVALPEATFLLLTQRRTRPDESVAQVIGRLARSQQAALVRHEDAAGKSGRVRAAVVAEPASLPGPGGTSRAPVACRYEVVVLGDRAPCASLADGLAHALRNLAELDGTFLQRFSRRGGRLRRHVASSPDLIHPERSDLNREYTRELWPGAGWWIGTNYSRQDVERILRDACELAGLKYGPDVVLRDAQC